MRALQRLLRALLWGAATGFATLAFDELLALVTSGFRVHLDPGFIAAQGAAGAAVAGLVEAAGLVSRRPRPSALGIVASTAAIVYAASVFERVEQALAYRWGTPGAAAAASLAVAGFAVWVLVLKWISRQGDHGSPGRGADFPVALILAAASVAVGLAVNRNLVTRPLEPAALAADAAVLALGLALACGVRFAGPLRTALAAAAVAAAAALAVGPFQAGPFQSRPPASGARPPHPHLVLVVIDTMRRDVFQAVVDGTAEGRRFREALGGAAWFDRAVSAAPWTAPSVASIMTGLYPPEHGFGAVVSPDPSRPLSRLSDSVTTLAERLRATGYQTAAIVANPILFPKSGFERGFERYELLGGPTTKMPLLTVMVRMGLLQRDLYQGAAEVRRRLAYRLGAFAPDRPLFLWLHLMDPHQPLHRHPDLSPDPHAEELQGDERLYYDEARYALREVTRIIGLLGDAGLWDDAVFVLVADHGEMFPRDGHGHLPPDHPRTTGHGHALYEELVRIPLVIRPPGGLPGERRIDVLASQVDLLATFRDLLGVDFPETAGERTSLAPWLAAEPPVERPPRRAYALIGAIQIGPQQQSVETDSYKLIRYANSGIPEELFDLAADPKERKNLARLDTATRGALDKLLTLAWSRMKPAGVTAPIAPDEEIRRRLEALGYLGGSAPKTR